jgi:rubrerythrin
MQKEVAELINIFSQTRSNVQTFMNMLTPFIESTTDEHLRMYFHHIFEEEEQHLERLNQFIPKLVELEQSYNRNEVSERKLISLLQDINLEKFGQHNFLEHLELSLFHFQTGEMNQKLHQMIDRTNNDYLIIKNILFQMNEQFLPEANISRESDHHDVHSAAHRNHAQPQPVHHTESQSLQKQLTVGSLKAR